MHVGQVISDSDSEAYSRLPDEPPEAPLGVAHYDPVYGISEIDEHNVKLRAPVDRFDMWRKMERTCAAVHEACEHMRGVVGSVTLSVTDGQHADELRRSIGIVDDSARGLPSHGARETLADMASALTDGIYLGAPAWELSDDGLYYPDRVEFRDPRTLESAVYDESGRLLGFIQSVRNARASRSVRAHLPLSQVIYCTGRNGTGPFGEGKKRVMYGDFVDLSELQRQVRGGVRKGVFRTVQVKFDDSGLTSRMQSTLAKLFNSQGADKGAFDRQSSAVQGIMSRVVSHVRGVFTLPPGWHAEQFGDIFDPSGPLAIERSRHRRILEVVHAGHMNTGAEGTGGTYNAAREMQRVSEVIKRTGVSRLIGAYNRGVVDQWYRFNYADVPVEERAYVTFSGLDWAQLSAMVEVVEKLGDRLGLDEDDINIIRQRSGFGPLSDGMRRVVGRNSLASAALGGLKRAPASALATLRGSKDTNDE